MGLIGGFWLSFGLCPRRVARRERVEGRVAHSTLNMDEGVGPLSVAVPFLGVRGPSGLGGVPLNRHQR